MIAVGVPKVTAAGTVLMGIAVGIPFELPVWQFFSTALELPIPTVRGFMVKLFPFALAAALAFVLVETRRMRHRARLVAQVRRREAPFTPRGPR